MRLVSPNQFIRRQAREDVTLGEQTIRAGDALLLILAAANRDPERSPTPTGSCSTVHKPSRSVTASITARRGLPIPRNAFVPPSPVNSAVLQIRRLGGLRNH
jgi:hypothetical protein